MSSYLQKRKAALFPLMEKKQEIDKQIVAAKEKQEYYANLLKTIQEALELARQAFQETENSLDEFGLKNRELLDLYNSQIQESLKVLGEFEVTINGFLLVVKTFDGKITEQKTILNELQKRQKELSESITRDSTIIAKHWKDLGIYKARLQAYIDESGAPIKMKFLNE